MTANERREKLLRAALRRSMVALDRCQQCLNPETGRRRMFHETGTLRFMDEYDVYQFLDEIKAQNRRAF